MKTGMATGKDLKLTVLTTGELKKHLATVTILQRDGGRREAQVGPGKIVLLRRGEKVVRVTMPFGT
jgi:hypothetical protein